MRKGASLLLAQALSILAAYDRCECWDEAAEEMKGVQGRSFFICPLNECC